MGITTGFLTLPSASTRPVRTWTSTSSGESECSVTFADTRTSSSRRISETPSPIDSTLNRGHSVSSFLGHAATSLLKTKCPVAHNWATGHFGKAQHLENQLQAQLN